MHQAKKSSSDTRNILTRWFERLTHLIEAFDEYILELAKNVLPIVRAGNPDVIVRLMKVVEMEAREDEKVSVCVYMQLHSGQVQTSGPTALCLCCYWLSSEVAFATPSRTSISEALPRGGVTSKPPIDRMSPGSRS